MDDLTLLAWSSWGHCSQRLDKHLHGYSTIQFVCDISSALWVAYDEREYLWNEGQWFFPAFPGPRLRFHSPDGGQWHHRHIGFCGPRVEKWKAAGIWLQAPQRAPEGENWIGRVEELIGWSRSGDRLNRLRVINGLERLLLDLAQARQTEARDEWLQAVLAHLESEDLDFAQLAREMGLSDTALRRRFKLKTGISMQDYRLNQRIARARVLLSDSELALKEIAARLGYANEFYFARHFKSATGLAPGAFRKSRLTG